MHVLVGKRKLNVADSGSGTPMLLIHGLGGKGAFARVEPILRRDHRVLIPDLAGYGDSERGEDRLDVEQWAEDMAQMLTRLVAEEAIVIGHSLGGLVAQTLAARHPQQVRSLVLANTFSDPTPERAAGMKSRAQDVRERGMEALADGMAAAMFAHRQDEVATELISICAQSNRSIDAETYAQACESLTDYSTKQLLAEIRCPTLVIGAAEDRSSTPEVNHDLQASIPESRLELIDGCGHLAPLEQPERFAQAVLNFLYEDGEEQGTQAGS